MRYRKNAFTCLHLAAIAEQLKDYESAQAMRKLASLWFRRAAREMCLAPN